MCDPWDLEFSAVRQMTAHFYKFNLSICSKCSRSDSFRSPHITKLLSQTSWSGVVLLKSYVRARCLNSAIYTFTAPTLSCFELETGISHMSLSLSLQSTLLITLKSYPHCFGHWPVWVATPISRPSPPRQPWKIAAWYLVDSSASFEIAAYSQSIAPAIYSLLWNHALW